ADRRQNALALNVAALLFRRQPGRAERLALAQALEASGRAAEAVDQLRPLQPGNAQEESAFLQALSAAYKQGAPVGDELRALVGKRLAEGNLSAAQRQDLVQ